MSQAGILKGRAAAAFLSQHVFFSARLTIARDDDDAARLASRNWTSAGKNMPSVSDQKTAHFDRRGSRENVKREESMDGRGEGELGELPPPPAFQLVSRFCPFF